MNDELDQIIADIQSGLNEDHHGTNEPSGPVVILGPAED